MLFNICGSYSLAKWMPVKCVYTPELLRTMQREMEAGEKLRGLEMERLVVTKVRKWNTMFVLVLCSVKVGIKVPTFCVGKFAEALSNVSKSVGHDQLHRFEE
ncbi:unnamed protein product [Peronospora destructor]|uniref:Uncharacterized protein n=1 Tax=Peronospora destructor TaxID=86335 RepID=A0AAV0VAX3_9STRA|nr:unnamed protein product [Peronospora destructor]